MADSEGGHMRDPRTHVYIFIKRKVVIENLQKP